MKADFEKGTKICCRCKKELPLDMFYKDKSRNDGLCCCCKKCSNEYSKAYSSSDRGRRYITKWWKGEIRHWTVKDDTLKNYTYEMVQAEMAHRQMKWSYTTKQMQMVTY